MQEHGSLPGSPGASGYAPDHEMKEHEGAEAREREHEGAEHHNSFRVGRVVFLRCDVESVTDVAPASNRPRMTETWTGPERIAGQVSASGRCF